MRAILLGSASGSSKDQRRLRRLVQIHSDDLLIGVDGGTQVWRKWGFQPNFAIGDWDSLRNPERILRGVPHVTLRKDKSRSDLFYAVLAAIYAGAKRIVCLGVTGQRPDHHLAVLQDLAYFSSGAQGRLDSVTALGLDARYEFISDKTESLKVEVPVGTILSVFAMCNSVEGVSLMGFRYPLKDALLTPSSHGLSNEAVRERCEVRLRKGQLLVIMPQHGSIR